jgi:hypothetical protein
VPAYQTADRKAYFMDLQGLLKLHGVNHWIYVFSGTIESFVETSFGGGPIYTFKHDSDGFYRSYVFLVNSDDDKLFLSFISTKTQTHLSMS